MKNIVTTSSSPFIEPVIEIKYREAVTPLLKDNKGVTPDYACNKFMSKARSFRCRSIDKLFKKCEDAMQEDIAFYKDFIKVNPKELMIFDEW